ncbi:rhodanese-like domain-containing protein 4A, chloroplastic [Rhododendron vialii]|uniref:rhodanese-like domain-containing protein 4A, chloroplastic n=1 Tax=Rhododendron vialii TaxID=182163 RepID=UPI00265DB1FC|nr:rhodanese-like domain-containing protein 4A, chloroplastic [Rhododendron vialii]
MESLSIGLSSSPGFQIHPKTHKPNFNSTPSLPNSIPNSNPNKTHLLFSSMKTPLPPQPKPLIHKPNPTFAVQTHSFLNGHLKSHLSFLSMSLSFPLSCFASDPSVPVEEASNRINLESVLIAIDDFNNRNPFFVAGVTFIWLVVIPLTEEYFQKYKFISAIDAFRKLRDDPSTQLLDIRNSKSVRFLGSPNLKIVGKALAQVEFREGDEDGFVKMVLEKFPEPANTIICILDNFDGNSMKVAELLFKNGFKEAYAIRGGVRGKKGWQEIQETLLPPSVHIYPKKKVKKMSEQLEMNGGVNQQT